MKRNPSIHITEKDLSLVLDSLMEQVDIALLSSNKLAKLILKNSYHRSCNGRAITVSSDRVEKKVDIVLKTSKGDAMLLSHILYTVRKSMKHRGVSKINQNSKDWASVKKLAKICLEFCNDFQLEKREGFITYVKLGMKKISSTRQYVSKLVNMQETISAEYEFLQIIEDDKNPRETEDIHNYYISMIVSQTGLDSNFKNEPRKYINFLKVREITDKMDVPFEIYIKAQFEGLAWSGNYPEPNQLVGEKAIDRLNKYLFQNKLKKKSEPKNNRNLGNVLQNIKNMK